MTKAKDKGLTEDAAEPKAIGVIWTLRPTFGFIRRVDIDTVTDNYFFIPSTLIYMGEYMFDELKEGWSVSFRPRVGPRGPYAIEVEVVSTAAPADFVPSNQREPEFKREFKESRRANKDARPKGSNRDRRSNGYRGDRDSSEHDLGGRARRR